MWGGQRAGRRDWPIPALTSCVLLAIPHGASGVMALGAPATGTSGVPWWPVCPPACAKSLMISLQSTLDRFRVGEEQEEVLGTSLV